MINFIVSAALGFAVGYFLGYNRRVTQLNTVIEQNTPKAPAPKATAPKK